MEILDLSEGEEAGIKGAVLEIKGQYAYGFLRPETGVHRLVRISPFDSQARRHTSFASVFVYPVVDNEINIEIRDEDIKMDVFRASGAGGQHVNKTSSAVRLTHIPTGIVVSCQQERSQGKNKATAMKMLKNRLYQLEVEKQAAEKAKLDATKTDVTFGNQIRSYVFQPYTMVNDHRTELKITDVQKVMDGGDRPVHRGVPQDSSAATAEPRGRRRRASDEAQLRDAGAAREARRARRARRRAVRVRVRPHARCGRGAVALHAAGRRGRRGGPRVRVAGRIVAWRAHGKTTFAHLADPSGRIQLYFKKDAARRRGVRAARAARPRRRDRRQRAALPHAHGRGDGARRPRSSCSPSRCGRCRSARRRWSTA